MSNIDPNWRYVEQALQDGTQAGYVLAILESEKILDQLSRQKGINGKNLEKRLQKLHSFVSSPQEFTQARLAKFQIMEKQGISFSNDEIKYIIRSYWQAYNDLKELPDRIDTETSLWQKIPLWIKLFIVMIFLILGIIVFINDTNTGKLIGSNILSIARLTIYWIFPSILTIILLFLASKKIFRKRKK